MQSCRQNSLVIFTDLDGSLLDHETYSHEAADDLLKKLEKQGVPVVFVSSKTASEISTLQESVGNRHPFIVENGAAVYIPDGYFPEQPADTHWVDGFWVRNFSLPRHHWVGKLKTIEPEFSGMFQSFSEMQFTDIMELTGLDRVGAEQAADRSFSEPVYWYGQKEQKQIFIHKLRALGCTLLQGGRFLHVSGDCDKGKALLWLQQVYGGYWPGFSTESIAIGDSQNDVAMLNAATYALIIRSPSHPPPTLSRTENILISEGYGPNGWVEGVIKLLPKHTN